MNKELQQCSVCRKVKYRNIDNVRAEPNLCTITEGCLGRLTIIKTLPKANSSTFKISDQNRNKIKAANEILDVSLLNSFTGTLILANLASDAEQKIIVKLEQAKNEEIKYQQFIFRNVESLTSVSGQDQNGKNLRFDQNAISENRISVKVDGVTRDVSLTPNTVIFQSPVSANSVIDIFVYSEKTTINKELIFTPNKIGNTNNAWNNVKHLQEITDSGLPNQTRMWVYSASGAAIFTPAKSRIVSASYENGDDIPLSNLKFLLSSTPFGNVDRYLNLYVSADSLNNEFVIISSVANIVVDFKILSEVFPPFRLDPVDSFFSPDTYITDSSLQTDSYLVRIASKKIIGPV